MYAWMWHRTPGPVWVRLLIWLAVGLAVVALLFGWVFPWVQSELPFTDVTVEAASSG
jgi:predicted exporter